MKWETKALNNLQYHANELFAMRRQWQNKKFNNTQMIDETISVLIETSQILCQLLKEKEDDWSEPVGTE